MSTLRDFNHVQTGGGVAVVETTSNAFTNCSATPPQRDLPAETADEEAKRVNEEAEERDREMVVDEPERAVETDE